MRKFIKQYLIVLAVLVALAAVIGYVLALGAVINWNPWVGWPLFFLGGVCPAFAAADWNDE